MIQRSPSVCTLARCQQCAIGRGALSYFVSEHQKVSMTRTCGSLYGVPGVKILRKDKMPPLLAAILPLKITKAHLTFRHRNFTFKCSNPTVLRPQRHIREKVAEGVTFYRFEQNFELWPEHTSNSESNGSRPQMLVKGLVFQNPFLRRVLCTNRIVKKPTRFGD